MFESLLKIRIKDCHKGRDFICKENWQLKGFLHICALNVPRIACKDGINVSTEATYSMMLLVGMWQLVCVLQLDMDMGAG